ncbi:MAG TPA: hypothetical protein VKE53_11750 [Pseudolabrys sp.]|nr:hypothetical protein [Pseudolabrys sp.]
MSGLPESATLCASGPQLFRQLSSIYSLAAIGAIIAGLTLAAPFAFKSGGDNVFIALTIPAGLLTIAATAVAERVPTTRALWLILGLAIVLRIVAISFEPLLSSDIYRYIWDGEVQAAGINPYRYVPADPALARIRDAAIFPNINRADYAVTIYPPVAQVFFLLVTRFGANTVVMRIALLACEATSVIIMLLLLKKLQSPLTRVVAYVWHPLPIWEIANSGHVDALMVALMLLGLWVALSGHTIRGAVLLALSTLAKSLAAPALAVIWRPWNWKMALAILATIALCYAPYLSVGAKVSGFLTGYLNEEGLLSGDSLWLLSVWRLIAGPHQGDVAIYFGLAGFLIVMLLLWVWRSPLRAPAFELADINMLLLAVLLLLSPNYPWYFLVIAPFVALLGNPPTWAASIGALLLTDEVHWDFLIPPMIAKSILFGAVLLAYIWQAWIAHAQAWQKQHVE